MIVRGVKEILDRFEGLVLFNGVHHGDDDGVDDEDDVGDELMILAWMCISPSKQQAGV